MNMHNARWTSLAVADVLHSSGRTIRSVAEETEIPYSTLRRKLASESAFTLSELYLLAGCLGVTPSRFLRPGSPAPVYAGGGERFGGGRPPLGPSRRTATTGNTSELAAHVYGVLRPPCSWRPGQPRRASVGAHPVTHKPPAVEFGVRWRCSVIA